MGVDLLALVQEAEEFSNTARDNLIHWVRWTRPQDQWLSLPAPRKLLRAGNQVGKTWAGAAEVIGRAQGLHPHYRVRKPPVEIWVVCTSWSQSVAVMGKVWELVPKSWLVPGQRFDLRTGFGKDNPALVFANGSVIRFKTTNQGPSAVATGTIDYVWIDEPTDFDIYRELDRRVTRRAGGIGITLTPINRPCGWLKEMVDGGVVREVHAKLTVENLTPVGDTAPLKLLDGTPMDAVWIEEQHRITPAMFQPVVLDGEWEIRPQGIFFKCFERARHVAAMKLDPRRGRVFWALGIDYSAADRPQGQTGVLVQVQSLTDDRGRPYQLIAVVDQVVMPGTASNEQFAGELLTMLGRHGLQWRDLHKVYGDNPVTSQWVEKSNIDTMRALAAELRIPQAGLQPRVLNAKEGTASYGTVATGCRYLYQGLASNRLVIHPRCEALARALETWDYTRDHPGKDQIDALRYALKDWIFGAGRGGETPTLIMR